MNVDPNVWAQFIAPEIEVKMDKDTKSERGKEVYQKNSDFVYRAIAGETILVPIRKAIKKLQSIYSLNETACCVWQNIDGRRTLAEIAQLLAAEYEVDSARLEADMAELLESLKGIGAVECVSYNM